MAVGPQRRRLFVGTRKTDVWAVTDRNKDGTPTRSSASPPASDFKIPNGVCCSQDGFLFVVEHNRVLTFPAAEFFYEGPDVAVADVVQQGKLIPHGGGDASTTARASAASVRTTSSTSRSASPTTCRRTDKVALYKEWASAASSA